MAKYEELGYCPNNAFGWCEHKTDAGKRALEILEDRIGYMVYETDSVSYSTGAYVVSAIAESTGSLGIEIASHLRCLIPECNYLENIGKKISCVDVINPNQLMGEIVYNNEDWINLDPHSGISLLQDERFLVTIKDEEEAVKIYIFKL